MKPKFNTGNSGDLKGDGPCGGVEFDVIFGGASGYGLTHRYGESEGKRIKVIRLRDTRRKSKARDLEW